MCFAMTALPLGCDKTESDSVLLNVVALADFFVHTDALTFC